MSGRARDLPKKRGSKGFAGLQVTHCDRAEFLCALIEEQIGLADAAVEVEQISAAVAALAKAGEARAELDKLRAYEADQATDRSLLEETRAMRRRADASGSHVAALQLLKVERELVAEADAARAQAEREQLSHLTEAEIVQMLVDSLHGLPVDLRDQVRELVFAPVH